MLAVSLIGALLVPLIPSFGAERVQQDVVVITQRWYEDPIDLSTAGSCFRAANDNVVEILKRSGMRCPKYQDDSSPTGEAPDENPRNSEGDEAVKRYEFVYQVRIRNSGQKAIKGIVWDYVFTEPNSENELARHTFSNDIKLLPGKTKSVTATSVKPPTRVISVRMLFSGDDGSYGEHVEVKRILYADGSVWQMDSTLKTPAQLSKF